MAMPWLGRALRVARLLTLAALLASCSDEADELGDADFSGFWDFDLTVVGTPCPGDESGVDCFGIVQDGLDLLIVDDAKGNLQGRVDGRDATISRERPEGSVFLTLHMNPDGRSMTGQAVEADSLQGCTTVLDMVGHRRESRCSN